MPQPRAVWLVGLRGPDPVEGVLSLDEGGLSFAPTEGDALRLSPARIRGARRLLASPVLKVAYVDRSGMREAFFFFVEPPPLPASSRVPGLSARGLQRTAGAFMLREQSKLLRGEVAAWAEEIRALRRRSPG